MDVLLESVQDLFFSGVAERMAVRGLCIDFAGICPAGRDRTLAPLQQQARENVGEAGKNAVGSAFVRVLYNEFEGLAELLVILGLLLVNARYRRFLIVKYPLPQAPTVRAPHFGHNIFRINAYDDHAARFDNVYLFQNLTAEDDQDTAALQQVVFLLDAHGKFSGFAEDADGQ